MKEEKKIYRFPAGPRDEEDVRAQRGNIRARLTEAGNSNIHYDDPERFVLCFMGTTPEDMAVEGYQAFLLAHPNNIGEHTRRIDELGFPGTQRLEQEVIGMLGDLHGDPEVDGYLSFDGTEANIQGCWVGRERLMKTVDDRESNRVCLLVSQLCHYSVNKAYRILRLGGGLMLLPTDEKGSVLVPAMESEIRRRYEDGQQRFLIVAVAGSTLLGSVDNVAAIGRMMTRLEREYNRGCASTAKRLGLYLHVDAAFGGFVTPFLQPPIKVGFNAHPKVSSMTIDPHKMGLMPYPAGAFLCRDGLIEEVKSQVGYVGGHGDVTLSGSRPGAAAAACWAGLKILGRRSYEEKVKRCMEVLRFLEERMASMREIRLYPPTLNVLAFAILDERFNKALDLLDKVESSGLHYDESLPSDFPEEFRSVTERYRRLQKKYILVSDAVPSDLGNVKSPPIRIVRFVLMPHQWLLEKGEQVFNSFLAEFRSLFN
ncbi:MAG: hypothetical protein HY982_00960 [Candidatus Magasanikbacteria bacterium]|nr:hypothetical protein [Candidatus Magasanikbacteria bacterium]